MIAFHVFFAGSAGARPRLLSRSRPSARGAPRRSGATPAPPRQALRARARAGPRFLCSRAKKKKKKKKPSSVWARRNSRQTSARARGRAVVVVRRRQVERTYRSPSRRRRSRSQPRRCLPFPPRSGWTCWPSYPACRRRRAWRRPSAACRRPPLAAVSSATSCLACAVTAAATLPSFFTE